ncbi:MAG: nucleoside triphosphate pyrophosphohydrolase [Candidatus Rokuibacteriota bacterium]|nr:MAG: nucleoside triphosphate pyrophosphohydrolase [Candidatus Rokubacteria bacterium]
MTESSGPLFEHLLRIMAQLRGPGGCPWDREQTPTSLKPYLIEEAYEVLEAIDAGGEHLTEELGDLLFQVVFHSQIAAERGEFTIHDVLRRLNDKMVSRHPHVFAGASVETPKQALAQWEALKQREAGDAGRTRSVIDGVPRTLPALLRAQRTQAKAARVHFDWPDAPAAWTKVEEEVREAAAALADGDRARFNEELGDVLFSLVNVARLASLDAEQALTGAIEKFCRRFTHMEADLSARGKSVASVSQEELEESWHVAKANERRSEQGRR